MDNLFDRMVNDFVPMTEEEMTDEEVEEPEEAGLDSQSEDSNEYDTELALMEQVPMIPTYGHFGMKTHFETKPVFTQMFGKLTSP